MNPRPEPCRPTGLRAPAVTPEDTSSLEGLPGRGRYNELRLLLPAGLPTTAAPSPGPPPLALPVMLPLRWMLMPLEAVDPRDITLPLFPEVVGPPRLLRASVEGRTLLSRGVERRESLR